MADEVTATQITNAINSEWIEPSFQDYARPFIVATQFCWEKDISEQATAKWTVPRLTSQMGTPSDGGASVDTEFDATDGTTLANTALGMTEASVTVAEYGIMRTVTDSALERNIMGVEFIQVVVGDNARILMTALEDDTCAKFSGFSNSSGATGTDMSLANLDDAITALRTRGIRAPEGLVGILDDEQANNFETTVTATNSATAKYDGIARDFMQIERDANNGLSNGRVARYKGIDLYATGLCDTANTAADVVGAVFVPDRGANRMFSALGLAVSRELRMEPERDAALRATKIVTTMSKGVGELQDGAGQALITDAP